MNIWRRAAAVGAVVALAVSVVAQSAQSAHAANTSSTAQAKSKQQQINSKLSQLKGELNEVSSDHAELLGKLDDVNNRKADLDAQITDLQSRIDEVQRQVDAAQAQMNAAQAEADQASASLNAAQAALAESTKILQNHAVDAYVGKDQGGTLPAFVFKSEDVSDLTAASEYLHQIVSDRRDVVEQHRELQGQAEDLKKQVEAKLAEAKAARDEIAKQRQALASQRSQLDALHSQVQAQADEQTKLLVEVEEKRANIQEQMADLQHESDSIATMLRGLGGSGPGIPPGKGILANPVPGAPLTSPFGMRLDPVVNVYQLHAGQDFGVRSGTGLRAAADGTVVTAGWVRGYGNYTCLNHGNGLATCYAHQSQISVSIGQHVSRNQIIGLSGSTGYSTGPHLHFEVRVNGTPVNPLGYL